MTDGSGKAPAGRTSGDDANRALVQAFFAASERGDVASVAAMIDDQMVMDWPQSGERFRGRENVLAAMAAVDAKPQFAGVPKLVGSGPLWVLMVPLRYGDDVLQYVAIVELSDDRIVRATGYWGASFPAQDARAPFIDRE
jgi:hypothetical protein